MCSPTLAIMGGAMALQGVGAIQSSNAASAAGKSQQAYYNYVAAQNKEQADAAIKVGEQKSAIEQNNGAITAMGAVKRAGELMATQKVVGAANGAGGGSVTAEDIVQDTMTKAQLDQEMIRYNADSASWSAKTGAAYQAWDYKNQSSLNKISGKNAAQAGKTNATTSLLSGASSMMSTAYQGSLYGAF